MRAAGTEMSFSKTASSEGASWRLDQLLHRALVHHPPAADDARVGGQPIGDLEHVRGEQQGDAAPRTARASSSRMTPAASTSMPSKGSSRKIELRRVDQRRGDGQPPPHALGVLGHERAGLVGQLGELQQLHGASGGLVSGQPVHAAAEGEVLPAGEALEEAELLGDHADAALDLQGLLDGVHAQHLDGAPVRAIDAGEDGQGGGLPGAIGAQERVEGASGNLEVEPVERGETAEAFDEPTGVNGQVGGGGRHVEPSLGRPSPCRQSPSPASSGGGQATSRQGWGMIQARYPADLIRNEPAWIPRQLSSPILQSTPSTPDAAASPAPNTLRAPSPELVSPVPAQLPPLEQNRPHHRRATSASPTRSRRCSTRTSGPEASSRLCPNWFAFAPHASQAAGKGMLGAAVAQHILDAAQGEPAAPSTDALDRGGLRGPRGSSWSALSHALSWYGLPRDVAAAPGLAQAG